MYHTIEELGIAGVMCTFVCDRYGFGINLIFSLHMEIITLLEEEAATTVPPPLRHLRLYGTNLLGWLKLAEGCEHFPTLLVAFKPLAYATGGVSQIL